MITSIEIQNLRGIREGTLEGFAPLTILTGPNASGKSTVLDALLIGASPEPAKALGQAVARHPEVPNGAPWLFWKDKTQAIVDLGTEQRLDSPTRSHFGRVITLSEHADTENTERSKLRPPVVEIEISQPITRARATVMFGADNRSTSTGDLSSQASGATRGPAFDSLPLVRLVDPGLPGARTDLNDEFTRISRGGRREAVDALLAELIPGFKRLEFLPLTTSEPGLAIMHEAGHSVPLALSGDGILAFTELTLKMAVPPGSLVLLEEPESYLHPRAIWQLARALLANMRRGVQMVLTTHSLELIDALLGEAEGDDLENLALFNLKLEDGKLLSGRHSGKEIEFARETLESDLR